MAIHPSTSVQNFPINKYTNSSYGGGGTCPDSISLEVQYKVTAVSGNTTTLQITLILHHAQINIAAGSNDCYFKIGTQEVQWTGPNLYSTTSGKTTTLGTKTVTITHDSDGTFANKTFIVRYRLNATYSGVTMYYITNYNMDDYKTITLDARYSSCAAPTSVSASGIITPTGSFTVSWSGASGGTNNSIVGYRIYYNISSNGAAPTTSSQNYVDVSSTATSGSRTITLSTAASRGYKIVCGVVTKGSAGSNYYSTIKTGGSVTINSLPAAPTVVASSTVIPSSGSRTITFTITPGADSDSSQTRTVKYKKTGDSQYTAIKSGDSLTLSSATNLDFWTNDGLEYSASYTRIIITKNTKPSITFTNATTVSSFSALGGSGASGHCLGWADAFVPTVTCTKTGILRKTVELIRFTSTPPSTFNPEKTHDYSNNSITSANTNIQLASTGPYTGITNKYGSTIDTTYNYGWRFKYILNDGVEDSDPTYYPGSGNYYAIPKMADITPSFQSGLYKTIELTAYKEFHTVDINITATVDGSTIPLTFENNPSEGNNVFTVTLSNAPSSEKNVVFTLTYTKSNLTKQAQTTIIARKTPSAFGELSISNLTLKPFTSTTSYVFTITWPFVNSNINNYKTDYRISSLGISLTKDGGSFSYTASDDQITKDGANLNITIPGSSFYSWDNAWGISDYTKQYSFNAKIQAISSYGETFISEERNFTVDFREPLSQVEITQIFCKVSVQNSVSFWPTEPSNWPGIAQNSWLTIYYSYKGYTPDTTTINFYFNNTSIRTIEVSNNLEEHHGEYTKSGYIVINDGSLPEILNNTSTIRFTATNGVGPQNSNNAVIKTIRQTAPVATLDTCEISDNYFSGTVTLSDFGIDMTTTGHQFECKIYDGTSNLTNNFTLTQVSGTTYSFSNVSCISNNWDVKNLTLHCISTILVLTPTSNSELVPYSRDFYLNYITVYQASPTVAYRKNSIGINTSSPNADAILDLHQSTNTHNVYFQGSRGTGDSLMPITWKFDVSEGIIQYTRNTTNYTLDLTNLLTIGTGATNAAAGNHAHGSVTNDGKITSNTAIATNDRIVFVDNSDSSKLKRSSIVFDTTVTNKYLSQAGTWADSLSTTTLTATGAISGASITTTGNGSIGGNLDIAGNVTFDGGNQTAERTIRFKNSTDSTYYHNTTIYGGNPESQTSLGIWDTAHSHSVMYYSGYNGNVGFLNDQTAISRGADFLILGNSMKSLFADAFQRRTSLTTEDLNDCTLPGVYIQHVSQNATTARHYPVGNYAGYLEVFPSATYTRYKLQRFTTYDSNYIYIRDLYGSTDSGATWSEWKRIFPTDVIVWSSTDVVPDLNDNSLKIRGYRIYDNVYSSSTLSSKNFPTTAAGFLECFYDSSVSARYIQRYTTYNSSAVYIRHYYDSTWSAWKKIFPVVYSGTDPTTTGIHTATVSADFNSSGVASVTVSGVTTSSHVIAQRVATASQTGNSWSVAAAVPTAANTVRLVQSSTTTASSVSINIIWW